MTAIYPLGETKEQEAIDVVHSLPKMEGHRNFSGAA